jgi:transcriptional regulator with XRE-family HTH domain
MSEYSIQKQTNRINFSLFKSLLRNRNHKRNRKGNPKINIKHLAEETGIDRGVLASYHTKDGPLPSLQELWRICEFYGVAIENLFGIKPIDLLADEALLKGEEVLNVNEKLQMSQVFCEVHEYADELFHKFYINKKEKC